MGVGVSPVRVRNITPYGYLSAALVSFCIAARRDVKIFSSRTAFRKFGISTYESTYRHIRVRVLVLVLYAYRDGAAISSLQLAEHWR